MSTTTFWIPGEPKAQPMLLFMLTPPDPARDGDPTDEEIVEAYGRHKSVWRTGEELGMSGQSVHSRLVKINGGNLKPPEFTPEQEERIREVYASGIRKGDGKLQALADELGKTKNNVCRWAGRHGLSNPNCGSTPELIAAQGKRVAEWIKKNGHPRGALGMKHTDRAKAIMGWKSWLASQNRTESERAEMNMKIIKTRVANGKGVVPRPNASWKCGWRTIGGIRKYYRSRWEANYARYLQMLLENGDFSKWEHEPETFWFEGIKRGSVSYLPDFRVTRNDGTVYYVEVKGWMDKRSKTKLKRMKKYHPEVEIELVDSKRYQALARTAGKVVPGWE